jgi:hypothetical protein
LQQCAGGAFRHAAPDATSASLSGSLNNPFRCTAHMSNMQRHVRCPSVADSNASNYPHFFVNDALADSVDASDVLLLMHMKR